MRINNNCWKVVSPINSLGNGSNRENLSAPPINSKKIRVLDMLAVPTKISVFLFELFDESMFKLIRSLRVPQLWNTDGKFTIVRYFSLTTLIKYYNSNHQLSMQLIEIQLQMEILKIPNIFQFHWNKR